MNRVHYHPGLKNLARKLRNNSTQAEIKLWGYLKGKRIMGYDFHRQKPISDVIVDFFCNRLRLAIEVDGYTHSFEETVQRDRVKEQKLDALGIRMLRFSDSDVMENAEGVLAEIHAFIREHEKTHTP